MNTPVSTTVISLEVTLPDGVVLEEAYAGFQKTVEAVAKQIGTVAKEPNGLQLTVTLPPNNTVGPLLQKLVDAFAAFESLCTPLLVRAVVHYGTVFGTVVAGKTSYFGSATRTSESSLKRTVLTSGLVATRGFAVYAGEFSPPLVALEARGGADAADGFSLVRLTPKSSNSADKPVDLSSANTDFIQFLKKRLAEDLGPFAGTMIESARRTCPTAPLLIAVMASEIDDKVARKRFESDLHAYLTARRKS